MLLSGVDGGATKTVAVVGRFDGTLLGSARVAPSNYHNVGINNAVKAIRLGVITACRRGGVSPKSLDAVVMGLAGMDSPRDFQVGRRVADLTRLGRRRIVKHDSEIALYAATLGRSGIVVNAGTGSFAAGLDENGVAVRAGGWGNIIDDEGSAYDIGKLGIRASLRALDGMEERTMISKLLCRKMKLRNLQDIVYQVHGKPMTVEEISGISKLVAQAAMKCDPVAREIFAHEGQILAKLVSTIAKRLRMTRSRPTVYLTGGVFKAGPAILNPFEHELRKSIRHFTIDRPRFEPAIGAFAVALRERNVEVRGQVLTNLQVSYECCAGRM